MPLRDAVPWTLLLATALSTGGTAAAPSLEWQCALEPGEPPHAYCRPLPLDVDVLGIAALAAQPSAPVRLLADAPGARALAERGDAEVFSADAWRVPLPTPHAAQARAALQALLCGARRACGVTLQSGALRVSRR